MAAAEQTKLGLCTRSVAEFKGAFAAYRVQGRMVLVFDIDSTDGNIIGILSCNDVALASKVTHPWIMLPEGSRIRHKQARERSLALRQNAWVMIEHSDHGVLLELISNEQVWCHFRADEFLKVPLFKSGKSQKKQPETSTSEGFGIPVKIHPRGSWGAAELKSLIKDAGQKLRKTAQGGPWIEYFTGASSLVLAAPHDGSFKPNILPRRNGGVMVRDTGSKGLAASVALELLNRGIAMPHLLVCHVSRTRLDVNRDREHAAEHPRALNAWDCYHALLADACAAAAAAMLRPALFVDFHAQANRRFSGLDVIELGTICPTAEDLEKGAPHLDSMAAVWLEGARLEALRLEGENKRSSFDILVEQIQPYFSMPRLAAAVLLRDESFAEFVCGANSFGGFLLQNGVLAVPSPKYPQPPPVLNAMRGAADEKKAKIASAALKSSRSLSLELASTSSIIVESSNQNRGSSAEATAMQCDAEHHGSEKSFTPVATHDANPKLPNEPLEERSDGRRDSEQGSTGLASSALPLKLSSEVSEHSESGYPKGIGPRACSDHEASESVSDEDVDVLPRNGECVRAPFFCGSSSVPLTKSCFTLDSIQLECPVRMTKNHLGWKALSQSLADSLEGFCWLHK